MDNKSSNGISKGELITTLSDIDLQINSLHERSASDFMQLNDHLKDYHKKTKIISENAFRIFETISGGKDMDLIRELENIQSRIDEYRKNIDDDNSNRLKIFKETGLHANQLNITIRNLRQDFTTLKFLSTNYSLISSYNESTAINDEGIKSWMSQISDIHHLLISINDQVEHFRELNSSVVARLEAGIERSLEIFQNLSDETIRNINSVTRKNSESKSHFPVLKEKSLDSSKCISDIITHLQYHDIIRQKIEHIQKSHAKIIEDLSSGEKNESCSSGDYEKIGDIIDLQSAQLLLVSKEYQNALNVITRNFQVIAKDMTIISDISDRFSLENSSSGITLLRQIKDQLDNGIVQLDQADALEIDLLTRQTLEKLQLISVRIENEIKPKLTSFLEFKPDSGTELSPASSNVTSQMIQLSNEIQIKNREIGDNLAFLKSLTRLLQGNDKGSVWGDFEIDRLQLMVRITRILDSLDHDNEELDKVLNENRELNDNILLKIESAINKNDYCEYFENIVGHVIGQLASVNERIKPSSSAMKKAVNLEGLKNGYTMESERLIHDMVVSGNDEPSADTDSSDSEIEFF
ncbi:MAG TPA: hypothetical protein VHO68_11005 [Bacteroidales bacterium]|nr:hypothetical protein [Bacteroidales bacterium]